MAWMSSALERWRRLLSLSAVAAVDILLQSFLFPKHCDLASWELSSRRKCVLVTGANAGLGRDLVKLLLSLPEHRRPENILMACRSVSRGEAALKFILSELNLDPTDVSVQVVQLDLGDLVSVRRLADQIRKDNVEIDALVCNAGVMAVERSAELLETHFAVNHLGHFLLTLLLIPTMRKSGASRIIVVSSAASLAGCIDLDDLSYDRRGYSKMLAYCDSKLANLLFAVELAKKLGRSEPDSGITVNAVHPGEVLTDISRNLPGWMGTIHRLMGSLLLSSAQSALALAYLVLHREVGNVTGRFFWHLNRGPPLHASAVDSTKLREELWSESVRLVSMSEKEKEMIGFHLV